MIVRYICVLLCMMIASVASHAQINTEQVTLMGRHALFFDDYLTAIRYFNMVIETKPYLEKPYYYRAYAKFNLEDFRGAEADCNQCLERNPFLTEVYQLRGLCRIHNQDLEGAVADYSKVLEDDPAEAVARYNRALCLMEQNKNKEAEIDIDELLKVEPRHGRAHLIKAQLRMVQEDTLHAIHWAENLLKLTPQDAEVWNYRGRLAMMTEHFETADTCLTKAIELEPQIAHHYMMRAQALHALNQFDRAIADYDVVVKYVPHHFVAHYNRGLLLAIIGKNNEAIADFDYVLNEEPSNTLARYNRALLFEKTGNFKAAADDLTLLIKDFPNFVYGHVMRAECRRKLGDVKGAQADEAFVQRAGLDLRYGKNQNKQIRKVVTQTEKTLANYQQPVMDVDTTKSLLNELIGKVQNLKHKREQLGVIHPAVAEGGQSEYFHNDINRQTLLDEEGMRVILTANVVHTQLSNNMAERAMQKISAAIGMGKDLHENLILRAIVHTHNYNFVDALDDIEGALKTDSTSLFARMQRMYIHIQWAQTEKKNAEARRMHLLLAERDANDILKLTNETWAPAFYNLAVVQTLLDQNTNAIENLTQAINIEQNLAPAYYNRALLLQDIGKHKDAELDLSKAGELGIYKAYSTLKSVREK